MGAGLTEVRQRLVRPRKLLSFVRDRCRRTRSRWRDQLVVDDFVVTSKADLRTPLYRHTDIDREHVNRCADEIRESDLLFGAHRTASEYRSWHPSPPSRCFALYVLVRRYSPTVLVETGVLDGLSTVYVLAAMEQNEVDGTLYSIDEPAPHLPPGKRPGWVIPDDLRSNWELTLGTSQDELEPLLERIDPPEFFYHDSWHTYPLMRYEFQTILDYMERGIVSGHDVNRNHAFIEVCSSVGGPLNVEDPFELGGMGVFGFTYVGESADSTPTKFPSHQYTAYDPMQVV